jgi:hypothetical protein
MTMRMPTPMPPSPPMISLPGGSAWASNRKDSHRSSSAVSVAPVCDAYAAGAGNRQHNASTTGFSYSSLSSNNDRLTPAAGYPAMNPTVNPNEGDRFDDLFVDLDQIISITDESSSEDEHRHHHQEDRLNDIGVNDRQLIMFPGHRIDEEWDSPTLAARALTFQDQPNYSHYDDKDDDIVAEPFLSLSFSTTAEPKLARTTTQSMAGFVTSSTMLTRDVSVNANDSATRSSALQQTSPSLLDSSSNPPFQWQHSYTYDGLKQTEERADSSVIGRSILNVPDLSSKPLIKKNTKKIAGQDCWNDRFFELCDFVKENGHSCVPHGYGPNPRLAQWVKRQRHHYRQKHSRSKSGQEKKKLIDSASGAAANSNSLTDEREAALNGLNFCWDSHASLWNERFKALLEYKDSYGHCNVPINYAGDKQLAVWTKTQRR